MFIAAAAGPTVGTEPDAGGLGRARRAFVAVAAVGVVLHGSFALADAPNAPVDNWLYCGLFFLAAASCAHRARRDHAGRSWAMAAVGLVVWGTAEVVFRLTTADPRLLYPPSTLVLLFAGFSLAYTTLGLLARDRVRRFDLVLALDGALAGLAAAAVASVMLFPAAAPHHSHTATPPRLFLLGALVGLTFVIAVLGMTGWRPGPLWGVIVAAIVVNVCGDIVLVHLANTGRFHRGSPADTLFVSSALLIGLAAFYPSLRSQVPQPPTRPLAAPLISAVTAFAVASAALVGGVGPLAAALAMTALAVTIIRMSVALDLLEHSRGEALTDPLTGLGNRRLLMRDLESRLGGRFSFTLALFDLDGFKRYNDTFGHPSGDALLVRLARRLAGSITPGIAYRMGGDEFCAILDGQGPATSAALSRAQEALCERGDAFEIRSSWGAVSCPAEANTARGALRVADARMYAAKTTRNLAQAQTRDAILKMLQERDPMLHDHMRAVAALSARVARRFGLDAPTLQLIESAAELHDIGKIAVPDAILHKSGTLNADERRFMRQYPVVGERILQTASALAPVARLVRACHERWDGRGYPDGLRHDQIPIGARIIAACDAYHSMRSEQPYRRARSRDEALAELKRCGGSQFDPSVVRVLRAEISEGPPE